MKQFVSYVSYLFYSQYMTIIILATKVVLKTSLWSINAYNK